MTEDVSLDAKYARNSGRVFISAIQALVRLPLDQARRDRARGLTTAGFVSGYRGSPLGGYDSALWAASDLLRAHDIRFNPGLNEELAATAMRGAQQLDWFEKPDVRGMFGLWYGKGLGVDRACEALKLGNLEGASANGGVLVVAGDDHGGKSSASAHQSEHTLIAGFMPILYPSDPAEILAYGIMGWEMSRYSGLWVGLKNVTDTLDLTASIELPSPHVAFIRPPTPKPLNLRMGQGSLAQEEWVVAHRLPAAQEFVRANRLDRGVFDGARRELTIVAAGKAYLDVREALADLGLAAAACAEIGVRLFKPAMIWPLEPEAIRTFVAGSREVLVVEEKRPVLEDQLARLLYALPADVRPALSGKQTPSGEPLLPSHGVLDPSLVLTAIVRRLAALGLLDAGRRKIVAEREERLWRGAHVPSGGIARPAYFCSGCPHNTSTRVPDGSAAMGAVGCHGLVSYIMPERRTMAPMPMGGEGMPFLAAAPHVGPTHMFQNMGDGTYEHSGILAIRAAVAAGTNITFKILFNDAVAMTGGQPVEGGASAPDIVRQLLAERVRPVVLVTDEPARYRDAGLPPEVEVHHRDELDTVQRAIRTAPGVSAIVYEQVCASEKRRRRKRGTAAVASRRVFINPEVCEDCGDCSVQSNCVSIVPLATDLGAKRRVDQSTCNTDLSCIKGFCPSFVTVEGGTIARDVEEFAAAGLPDPETASLNRVFNVVVAGIGGTGVLTIGAILGMAAHLQGLHCKVLDTTGIAQKGGAVTSHLRIAAGPDAIFSARLDGEMADVVIGCDMVVASGADVLRCARADNTKFVVNSDVTPTGDFQRNRDAAPDAAAMLEAIRVVLGEREPHALDATRLATRFMGDSIAANMIMVGYAAQKGWLPLAWTSIERAIEVNGIAVDGNLRALLLGRLAAHDPAAFGRIEKPMDPDVATLVARRVADLTLYQNAAYARRYRQLVDDVTSAVGTQGEALTRAVATSMAKLMAYKDEYEIGRLYTDRRFEARLREQFAGDIALTYHFAPPILSGTDRATRRPRKRAFGGWMRTGLAVLASLKVLRGTAFDPFGRTAERRAERELIAEYERIIRGLLGGLGQGDFTRAVEIATAPQEIRGFGPVKAAAIEAYRRRLEALLQMPDVAVTSAPGEKERRAC